MKKVLIIGYCNQFFRREFVKNIKSDEITFDILSFEECEEQYRELYNQVIVCETKAKGKLGVISVYIKFLMCLHKLDYYDAIHIHSVKKVYSFYARSLKKKCKKLICTIYGSDFYRVSDKNRNKLVKLFRKSDVITMETLNLTYDFNQFYKSEFSDKLVQLSQGVATLGYLKKCYVNQKEYRKEFNIPEDSYVITVGYNAIPEQNHFRVLEQLKRIESKLPNNYFIVLPLGYGNESYGKKVNEYLEETRLRGICLFDFYDNEKVAKLRVSSDLMVQVQNTDLISSSMIEYLYAGNKIITGKWLNYIELKKYIYEVDSIEQVGDKILEVYNCDLKYDIEECRQIIDYKMSWEEVKHRWVSLYQ